MATDDNPDRIDLPEGWAIEGTWSRDRGAEVNTDPTNEQIQDADMVRISKTYDDGEKIYRTLHAPLDDWQDIADYILYTDLEY